MTRSWLRSSRALAAINTVGVGVALAAAAGSLIFRVFGDGEQPGPTRSWFVALPTLVVGVLWAALLRKPPMWGWKIRVGWIASVPLAATNAGLACAFLVSGSAAPSLAGGFALGVILGAVVWVPSLLVTLACFGLPIAWAQKASQRGLVGEERGELVVGLAVLAVASVGLCAHVDSLTQALSLAGMTLGGTAAALALARERRRARFVADVAAGRVKGFRVEATHQGRALVRMNPDGAAYRVSTFDEEIIPLDTTPLREREGYRYQWPG